MDKFAVSGIDACVGDASAGIAAEEDDIACFQLGFFNGSTLGDLACGCPVRGEADLLEHIVDKAGAVKAAGGSAASHIRTAQILLGFRQNLAAGDGGAFRDRRCGRTAQGSSTGGSSGGNASAEESYE